MSFIVSSKSVFPEFEYNQDYFIDFLATNWPDKKEEIAKFAKSVCVDHRALCLSLKDVMKLNGFAQRNEIWKDKAFELSKRSIDKVLADTGLSVKDINYFITTSVTGFAIPSLDALLMNRMEFSDRTKRLPIFGFGCLGGVASLNRAHEYLQNNPSDVVLINAVELCSLTFQKDDLTIANLVGTSLFGDGASSVIMVGDKHPLAKRSKYKVLNYGTFFYKNSEDTMGWSIRESGFKLLLNKNVSSIVKENVPHNVNDLLKETHLEMEDIKFSISHPGGPKVLIAMQEALNLKTEDFANSWESLREHGNLSSVSVLNVLERSLNNGLGREGDVGIMAAMGPGFNSEITLVKAVK